MSGRESRWSESERGFDGGSRHRLRDLVTPLCTLLPLGAAAAVPVKSAFEV
ncbi:MAG TPA: hypothetical protein VNK51_24075 [Bradyrhizobium sp.]|jgi:hypothetical protein|nr:hypothetical protein [Bradyrhizobium sp.]